MFYSKIRGAFFEPISVVSKDVAKNGYSPRHVYDCLSVRIKKGYSHLMDYRKASYSGFSIKLADAFWFFLKSD